MSASKVLGIACLTLILLLTVTGTGFAQDTQPPKPPDIPFEPPFPPGKYLHEGGQLGEGSPIIAQAASGLSAQALTLGAVGLNFSYAQTFGTTEIPYLSDTVHLNYPWGIATDGANVLIGEHLGHRVLKYTNTGAYVSTIGTAGTDYNNGEPGDVFDMAVDNSGQTWVVDNYGGVIKFDVSNNFVEYFHDDGTFSRPAGIAFDSAGNVYISDGATFWNDDIGNHQVLVFDSAGTLLSTIGMTGVTGTDNNHFFGPQHIAVYGNLLYVGDGGNNRIQIFDITTPTAPVYSATIGVTGVSGADNDHLDHPVGVAVDANYIYVADRWNNRVQVFTRTTRAYVTTIGTGWGTGNDQFKDPTDVAVDSAGNIYVADFVNSRVQQFNSSYVYQRTYGVTNTPYLTDNDHLNSPSDVAIAPDGSMYITEDNGQRLIKLNANGTTAWIIGAAGIKFPDWPPANDRLNNPSDIALNATGQVYVADRWHNRIQVYNPDGTYASTIGGGTGNFEFQCPTGLTIAPNGYIYMTDCWRHRVQIFNAQHTYVGTLGVTDVPGSDNAHFNNPEGVAVDGNGFIYVADSVNHRVQVFNASRAYVRTLGVTGISGSDFAHFNYPTRLAVDSNNRVYVSDTDNNRVQIFDSNGAYLTTIGGAWGDQSGMLRNPQGLGIDQNGVLYVADSGNHRIQKFTIGTPNWAQANLNGFGEQANRIASLGSFGNQLYAGTYNFGGNGAQLWRSTTGTDWTSVITNGFGNSSNVGIEYLIEFNGNLYAGIWNSTNTPPNHTNGGEIWRSPDGNAWTQVVSGGFGDPTNGEVIHMAVFNSQLYASTWSHTDTHGTEIWRSSTGNTGDWTKVVGNGLGDITNISAVAMETFNGYLYAGTYSWDSVNNRPGGCEVWRTDGVTWTKVVTDGFGNLNCYAASSLTVFGDSLYAGTGTWDPVTQTSTGGQVWRCTAASGCDAVSDWTQVIADGFGNPQNDSITALRVIGTRLYAVTANYPTGLEVWQTEDGTTWLRAGSGGFGDSNNGASLYDNSVTVFNSSLFVGTTNRANGGEIWLASITPTTLVNSVLPTSRTVPMGNMATIFNTVINAGTTTASGLTLSMNPAPAGTFAYQQTDCATNAVISSPNPSLDLAPGGVLCYVLSFTPSATFSATSVHIRAQASNAPSTNLLTGINTWLLRSTNVAGPDIIALTTTTDFHQVACSGANAFAVALSNVGAASTGDITAVANTGSAILPLSISISETDPATGAIIGDNLLQNVGAGENRTVAVFVTFKGCVAFDPAANRIFIEFRDASNNVVGSTSTAVSTGR